MVVAQNLLYSPNVHAVLQHQSGGSVPQLVGGILAAVDTGLVLTLFSDGMDRGTADALILGR